MGQSRQRPRPRRHGGHVAAGDCEARYYKGDRLLAVATIGRDLDNLRAEAAFEKAIGAAEGLEAVEVRS